MESPAWLLRLTKGPGPDQLEGKESCASQLHVLSDRILTATCTLEAGAVTTAPILEMGKLRLRKVTRAEEGPGNGSCKGQRTQKFIADHDTALWREENEGGEWGPLPCLPPTAAQVRKLDPQEEHQAERTHLLQPSKRIKTECPHPPTHPRTTKFVLRTSFELPTHMHAHNPGSGPCTPALLPPRANCQ